MFLESLDLDERVYQEGNLIVVDERGRGDGGFVQHFIVADFLRRFGGDSRIILVLTHQSELHWASIAGKVGWNLPASKEKGQVVTIDLVKEAYNKLMSPEEIGSTLPDSGLINNSTGSIDLEKLFKEISHFSSSSGDSADGKVKVRQLIVIEDLSSLLYQSERSSTTDHQQKSAEKDVMEFIWKLKNFSATRETCLLTSVNSAEESGDAVGTRFAKLVAQVLGQVSIQVSPLSTGFSPQISGYLTTRSKINGSPKWVKSNHYKLEDRHIRVTPLA